MTTESHTQFTYAQSGKTTPTMERVAQEEHVSVENIRDLVSRGHAVIPANIRHTSLAPKGIGASLSTKINANIGNSPTTEGIQDQLNKLETVETYGADAVMDLSTGPQVTKIRQAILQRATIPVGTVPIYEAAYWCSDPVQMSSDFLLDIIRQHAQQGVDFVTLHAGILADHLDAASERTLGIVSRGGALLANWMRRHSCENPLYTRFQEVLDICRAYDMTVSLGDGLRPGCIADASDTAQFAELEVLGQLVRECRQNGVQVMVEGPGHIPIDQVQMNMEREADICDGAPFYILGPVVTDAAPGYDHLTGAIGGALGAFHGAAMLCYVTPKEHLGLPNESDVAEGITAFRIAAHAADIGKGLPGVKDRDKDISQARRNFDWRGQLAAALEPKKPRSVMHQAQGRTDRGASNQQTTSEKKESTERTFEEGEEYTNDYCTMCGPDYCSLRLSQRLFSEAESSD